MELSSTDADKLRSFIDCYVETPLLRIIQDDFDRLRYEIDAAGKEEVLIPTQFTDKIPISQLLKKR